MLDLTFGEQVKIILSRKGMTIKELAETIETQTGKKMSRQNLTQRLGRDNFQEQDMRMIAEILGCPFQLSILGETIPTEITHNNIEDRQEKVPAEVAPVAHERDITIGELVEIHEVLDALEENAELPAADCERTEYEAPVRKLAAGEQEDLPEETSRQVTEEDPNESQEEATEEDPNESQEEAVEEDPNESQEEAAEEDPNESQEEAAEVITEEPEKKPHGWRAYLKWRKKKQEVSQPLEASSRQEEEQEPRTRDEYIAAEHEQEQYSKETAQAEHEDYQQTESVTDRYKENYTEDTADIGYADKAYMQEGHADEAYVECMDEEHTQEGYMGAVQAAEDDVKENDAEGDVQEAYGQEPEILEEEEDLISGDVNPYTGREYQSNSVRMHPTRIGYVQVYDRSNHAWTDMTEWAFLGYQERKKMLLGKDYDPPIYLD